MSGEAVPRPMRRAGREVRDLAELRFVVERSAVVRVGSVDAEGPFVVPMSFGFELDESGDEPRWTFWLHSAREGRKADAWAADPRVALELDVPAGVVRGDYSCAFSYAYESVMASGRASLVEGRAEKVRGLRLIMDHMAPGEPVSFSDEAVARVAVWRVDVGRLTGKRRS